jgi:hypothetical protein
MRRLPVVVLLTAVALCPPPVTAQEPASPPPAPCDGCYVPATGLDWQYQLRSAPDPARRFDLWIVDMFDTDAALVEKLHQTGAASRAT